MIKNDKQLEEAKKQLQGWLDSFKKMELALPGDAFSAYRQAHEPMLLELQKAINEYQTLAKGRIETPYFEDPYEIGRWIIKHRIRTGVTQTALAEKLGLSQAQISRDEDVEYRNLPFMRLMEIMKIFGYSIFELLFFRSKTEKLQCFVAKAWAQESTLRIFKKFPNYMPALVKSNSRNAHMALVKND